MFYLLWVNAHESIQIFSVRILFITGADIIILKCKTKIINVYLRKM